MFTTCSRVLALLFVSNFSFAVGIRKRSSSVAPDPLVGTQIGLHNPNQDRWLRIREGGGVDAPVRGQFRNFWRGERFDVRDAGNGHVGLWSSWNSYWLAVNEQGGLVTYQRAWHYDPGWTMESFEVHRLGKGEIALRNVHWNRWVYANSMGNVGAHWTGGWQSWWQSERFEVQVLWSPAMIVGARIGLRNPWTDRWLRITDSGYTDAPARGGWQNYYNYEVFEVKDVGRGQVALFNVKTKRWLRMRPDGVVDGIPQWSEQEPFNPAWTWERFTTFEVDSGHIAFYSKMHDRWLRLVDDGTVDCQVQGGWNWAWTWERFEIKFLEKVSC